MAVSVKRSYIVKIAIERLKDAEKKKRSLTDIRIKQTEVRIRGRVEPTNCRTISKTFRCAVNLFFCPDASGNRRRIRLNCWGTPVRCFVTIRRMWLFFEHCYLTLIRI
ncbi:hypothetical protein GGD38_003949 [Chitinophagaceae bacterium OAS944]|nr:hypothetical protein [Chitinophagaceae bacterium OAS944]